MKPFPIDIHKLIDAQKDIIQMEERKQDGLKRLAAVSPDNTVTRGVQQQLIDSSMTMKQAQRNVQTLTVCVICAERRFETHTSGAVEGHFMRVLAPSQTINRRQ